MKLRNPVNGAANGPIHFLPTRLPNWQVPLALVVANCRTGPAVKARLEAMQAMFALGLKRCQIAAAFGRDLRRVRSSVIGGSPRNPNRLDLVF